MAVRKNKCTKEFRKRFERLPEHIQETAKAAFRAFCKDPSHHALRHHKLEDTGKGRHKNESWSVSITMNYRAIYVIDGDCNVWYWIGTHAEYDKFTGNK